MRTLENSGWLVAWLKGGAEKLPKAVEEGPLGSSAYPNYTFSNSRLISFLLCLR